MYSQAIGGRRVGSRDYKLYNRQGMHSYPSDTVDPDKRLRAYAMLKDSPVVMSVAYLAEIVGMPKGRADGKRLAKALSNHHIDVFWTETRKPLHVGLVDRHDD